MIVVWDSDHLVYCRGAVGGMYGIVLDIVEIPNSFYTGMNLF